MAVDAIFISYRRRDASGWAGRLHSDLRSRLGPGTTIFMDVDGIPPGADFASYIDESIEVCDALLAVVGPNWAGELADGTRRIDRPDDWVRLEVAAALRRKIKVVPVHVDDAVLPARDSLPAEIGELADRQSLVLNNLVWDAAVDRLVSSFADPPPLVVSPPRLEFGAVPVNSSPPRQLLRLADVGRGTQPPRVTVSNSRIVTERRGAELDVWLDTTVAGELHGHIKITKAGRAQSIPVSAVVVGEAQTSGSSRSEQPGPSPRHDVRWPLAQHAVSPASFFALSLIATILSVGVGAVALAYSLRAQKLYRRGDVVRARRSAETALATGLSIAIVAVVFWMGYGIPRLVFGP